MTQSPVTLYRKKAWTWITALLDEIPAHTPPSLPRILSLDKKSIHASAENRKALYELLQSTPVEIDARQEVQISMPVTLEDYRQVTAPADFALVAELAQAFEGKRLIFISATPQGGGVALMRHALIRLMRLLGVDAHWYVLAPQKAAFAITKTKFHNVLQAVSPPIPHSLLGIKRSMGTGYRRTRACCTRHSRRPMSS